MIYEVGLWCGCGYQLTTFIVQADHEEQALERAVVQAENENQTHLFFDDVEDVEEHEDLYMYVDATMEGANSPHYVDAQNLRIRRIDKCERILQLLEQGKMVRVNNCDMVLTPDSQYITWYHFGSSANRKSVEDVYRILALFADDGDLRSPVYINEDRSHYSRNPKLKLVEM